MDKQSSVVNSKILVDQQAQSLADAETVLSGCDNEWDKTNVCIHIFQYGLPDNLVFFCNILRTFCK